jgi:hypothetical protein
MANNLRSNLRRRRYVEGDDDRHCSEDTVYIRPSIRMGNKKEGMLSTSRWFASQGRSHEPSGDQQQQNQTQNDSSIIPTVDVKNNTDNSDLPLLYSLARSWAWEAVTFRCTTHPQEVDVKFRDYRGDTSLHWAAFGRPPIETVHALLQACPDMARTPNFSGTLPLHVACSYRASSAVIQEILNAYPEAAATPDGNGATPLHYLCDYGSNNSNETISSIKVLLRCFPHGIQSVMMTDYRYQRRPLYILNARKNIREQEQYIETIRNRRFRQRALREELKNSETWNQNLKYELMDHLEDDISDICRESAFWKMVSLLIVAEYEYTYNYSEDRTMMVSPLSDFLADSDDNSFADGAIEDKITEESRILHAFVKSLDCPPALQEFAILLYEPYLLAPSILDDRSLPLHVAASMYNSVTNATGSTDRLSHLIALLVDGGPEAASVRDANDQLPLHLILNEQPRNDNKPSELKTTQWSNGLQSLIDVYPLAILEANVFTHQKELLLPSVLSRLGTNRNTIYTIIRDDPTLLTSSTLFEQSLY